MQQHALTKWMMDRQSD